MSREVQDSATFYLFLISAFAMLAGGYLLTLVAPTASSEAVSLGKALLLEHRTDLAPEPHDPFLFVTISLLAVVVLAVVFAWSAKSQRARPVPAPVFWSILMLAVLVIVVNGGLSGDRAFLNAAAGLLAVATTAFAYRAISRPTDQIRQILRWSITAMLPGAALLILVQRIWTEGSLMYRGPLSSHYEAATSAAVRIATGGTCLADVLPQYGCYGEFVAPLLHIFGNTVTVVTTLFALLLVVAVWAALRFCALVIDTPIVLFGCSVCLVSAAAFNLVYHVNDPALQYFPLRFLFPALSLLAAAYFQKSSKPATALTLGLFAGAALAWNLESGVAVLISLAAFVAVGNFTARPWQDRVWVRAGLKNVAAYLIGAATFVSLFVGYLIIKSDHPVELANLVVFQTTFAVVGFGMIPIPAFPHYWTIHAAVLFGTLFLATVAASRHDAPRDKQLELATYLAVLGIGLAIYYVGRSHILVLRLVMWPSIVLFFFLLDRTLATASGSFSRMATHIAAATAIGLSSAFFLSALPSVANVAAKARSAPTAENLAIREDIGFIRSRTSPGEGVAIISVNQGILYGHSGTRAVIEGPGVAEFIRRLDLQQLMEFLVERGPEKLFIGTNLDTAADMGILGTNIPIDFALLETVYDVEPVPGGRLLFLTRQTR